MKFFKNILLIITLLTAYMQASAQLKQNPKWDLSVNKKNLQVGDELELIFQSKIEKDWYMYSSDFSEDVGPIVALFEFKKHPSYKLIGKIKPVGAHHKFDDVFGGEVSTFTGMAEF